MVSQTQNEKYMRMKYSCIFLWCLFCLTCFGQKKPDRLPIDSNSCNTSVAAIDPSVFVIDTIVLQREPSKKIKRPLKLGIKGHCLYIIDSVGTIQPYTVVSFYFSMSWRGTNGPFLNIGNHIDGSCHFGLMSFFCGNRVGTRFFLDTVTVEDKTGKRKTGLIEPLTVIKIK